MASVPSATVIGYEPGLDALVALVAYCATPVTRLAVSLPTKPVIVGAGNAAGLIVAPKETVTDGPVTVRGAATTVSVCVTGVAPA